MSNERSSLLGNLYDSSNTRQQKINDIRRISDQIEQHLKDGAIDYSESEDDVKYLSFNDGSKIAVYAHTPDHDCGLNCKCFADKVCRPTVCKMKLDNDSSTYNANDARYVDEVSSPLTIDQNMRGGGKKNSSSSESSSTTDGIEVSSGGLNTTDIDKLHKKIFNSETDDIGTLTDDNFTEHVQDIMRRIDNKKKGYDTEDREILDMRTDSKSLMSDSEKYMAKPLKKNSKYY